MREVLVIGGGWAGIAAAMEAAGNGCRVTMVEERPYLGGRARSFTDRATGEEIDNGQHLMMGCYHGAMHVLRELGTDQFIEPQSALKVRFVEVGGITDVLDAGLIPGAVGVAAGIMRLRRLSLRSRLGILDLAVRLRSGRVSSTGLSCEIFLKRYGQTPQAITRFWEPIILATLNAPMQEAAAELLVAVMRLAFLGGVEDSKLYLPTSGLSTLLEPFPQWLANHHGTLHLSTSCDALEIVDGRIVSATLSDGQVLKPDLVISAVPQRAERRLLGDYLKDYREDYRKDYREDYREDYRKDYRLDYPLGDSQILTFSHSPIVSVYLWYDRPWMTDDFVAALGTTVQWVFNRRRLQRAASRETVERYPGHVSLTISAGSDLAQSSGEEIIGRCDGELRQLFPEMTEAVLLHGQVIKEKSATPLLTAESLAHRPSVTAYHGIASNLYLAGDWTNTGLPATIEGAVRSGVAAARDAGRH